MNSIISCVGFPFIHIYFNKKKYFKNQSTFHSLIELPLDLMERRDFLDTVDTDDSLLASPDCLLGLGKLDVDMLEGFLDTVDTRDIFLSP